MKTKGFLLFVIGVLLCLSASAEEVVIDGIKYQLISKANSAEVISYSYSGNVTIPSSVIYNGSSYSVTAISSKAFSHNTSLTSVTIPNSVTSIGDNAFYGCSGLTSITIPNSITSIGSFAFYYCTGLTSITIPNSVTSIGSSAFKFCIGLTSVTIPNSVTTISNNSFCGCMGLTSVTIPNSVTSIDDYAFAGCSGLTSITIPNSVTSIGKYVFDTCSGLTSFTIPNSVTTISDYTFKDCTGLTSFTIPNWVTSIGSFAFCGCTGLTSITIPNSVTTIGISAFQDCTGLTSVTIPNSVTYVGSSAFLRCTSLTSITIPNSVTTIGLGVFEDCTGLTSVTFPNSVTSISNGTFKGCTGLTSFTIHDCVTSIGKYAFSGCTSLTAITIPNSVSFIGTNAFDGCTNLISVSIGKTIKTIQNAVFSNCQNLTDVTCMAKTIPTTASDAFNNSYIEYATLHVPESAIDSYKAASPWSGFKEIVAIPGATYTLQYVVDGEEYKSYRIEEGENITPEPAPTKEGYTFSGWSEIPETMPDHDVTVTGSFTVNKYKLTYIVDGEVYKNYDVEFGASITPEADPTKEGYTFSGWSEIPATMPAHDVTVTGNFTANLPDKFKLTYMVDGEEYKSFMLKAGSTIIPIDEPTKEGYTFSGWSEIPEEMPAHDVVVTGTFTLIPLGTCATPTVSIVNGRLHFDCETPDVTFHYDITRIDKFSGEGNDVDLSNVYEVTVYATRDQYTRSETVTVTIKVEKSGTSGDVNNDGVVDIADAVTIVNCIIGKKE